MYENDIRYMITFLSQQSFSGKTDLSEKSPFLGTTYFLTKPKKHPKPNKLPNKLHFQIPVLYL